MAYKQVDGKKDVLVREDGSVRHLLRTLSEESDRVIRKRDDQGNLLNEWPEIVVAVTDEHGEDRRLLPELVLKLHGGLPKGVPCSPSDFKSKSGSKNRLKDCSIENIEYVGEASRAEGKPYVAPPEETEQGQPSTEAPPEPEPEPEKQPDDLPQAPGKPSEEIPDLQKGSAELTAKRAIELIRKYDFEELQDVGFFTEESTEGHNPRVTVVDAWKKAKKDFEAESS